MKKGKRPENGLQTTDLPTMPNGWCWAPLGEIAEIASGITKGQRHRPGTRLREVPYLRVANVQRGYLDLTEITTIPAREDKIQALLLRVGDILFTEGGDRDKLGRGWIWNDEIPTCIHQNHIFRARLFSNTMSPKFVSFHGNFFGQDWFPHNGKQTTNLASINQSVLRRFPVPVPPAAEQRRIVTKLEELFSDLDAGVAALERVKANLKRYRASVLKAAVEGKLTEEWRRENPPKETASQLLDRILRERRKRWEEQQLAAYEAKGKKPPKGWHSRYKDPTPPETDGLPELPSQWCWASVEQVSSLVTDGDHNPPKRVPTGVAHLTAKHIKRYQILFDNCTYITEADFERTRARYEPLADDVIVTCVGTVGEVAVVPEGICFSADRNLAAVRLIPNGVRPQTLQYVLSSPLWRKRTSTASGATAQPHLYLGDLRALPVPVMPRGDCRWSQQQTLKSSDH